MPLSAPRPFRHEHGELLGVEDIAGLDCLSGLRELPHRLPARQHIQCLLQCREVIGGDQDRYGMPMAGDLHPLMSPFHLINEFRQAVSRIGERYDSHAIEDTKNWREVKADR